MFYVTTMQECQRLNLNPAQFLPDLIFIISPDCLQHVYQWLKMFQSEGEIFK